MNVAQDIFTLTAETLMSRESIALPEDMLIPEAAHILAQAKIGSASVVDAQGRCVGMFSTVEILKQKQSANRTVHVQPQVPGCVCSEWEILDDEDWDSFPADAVSRYMTPQPVMVSPATPLIELAARMAGTRVHRVVVVDASQRPLGVVSSMDILAALAVANCQDK